MEKKSTIKLLFSPPVFMPVVGKEISTGNRFRRKRKGIA
jgi:hypothetical protein